MNTNKSVKCIFFLLYLFLAACSKQPPVSAYTGYIEGNYFYVSAPEPGWIINLSVKEGDTVSPDSIIAQLDDEYQRLAIAQAEKQLASTAAQLEDIQSGAREEELLAQQNLLEQKQLALDLAKSEYLRLENLHRKNLVSETELETSKSYQLQLAANVSSLNHTINVMKMAARPAVITSHEQQLEVAKIELQKAQWLHSKRILSAKNSGVVEQVFQRHGEYVKQGQPIVSVLINDSQKVRFYVEQSQLSRVKVGQYVDINLDNDTQTHKAKVQFIAQEPEFTPPVLYNQSSRSSLVFMVEAQLAPATKLHIGQPVDVSFHE
ncbi:HlyD family efflux transporter periplasmic adaptor subunit [Psychrosphaera sp. 1_MG-2023]|uniref:HlyD family efflux transporter periplasmic adaptor subunit n=1 Tax=Psychrosphaera algicola TaxID=3023714 RepID=A0ABT5FFM2_9GAMM|nr:MULTISPECIES: HlyD family efflux transporter periplasmic adaptor subunit [unclassified Psychrosphaera]MDC2889401.1 HlyD family efflux transporter periplasmic adaptor subunit [Psychrosphaera sp. G1-22]MDO6718282.1 HlyD family efflux transporter periplasmic adaptor subunit [Psychrosphaera sp. 1_MG-2023]